MKNSRALYQEAVKKITLSESVDEIKSMVLLLMEHTFGISRTDIVAGKPIVPEPQQLSQLDQYIERMNTGEPVQYILEEAYFCGRIFHVNPSVLIPRPETEVLISVILSWEKKYRPEGAGRIKVLDIGTGSGCIPVTLRLEWPLSDVYATDISAAALKVARHNAERHQAEISFLKHDILHDDIPFGDIDVIISNPPYVTRSEANDMKQNVLGFEPHGALFVPDDDPFIFYKEIVSKSKAVLAHAGLLAVEINEKFGREIAGIFHAEGFIHVEVVNDVDGKPRVVQGLC